MTGPLPARWWVGALVAGVVACDRGNQPLSPARQGPALRIVATSPTSEQTGVALDAALRIRFDRFLDSTSVVRQSVRITGGTLNPDGSSVAGGASRPDRYRAFAPATRRRYHRTIHHASDTAA